MLDAQTVTNIVIGIFVAIGVVAQQWDRRQRKKMSDLESENNHLRDFKIDSTAYILKLVAAIRAHNARGHSNGENAMRELPIPRRLRRDIDPTGELGDGSDE